MPNDSQSRSPISADGPWFDEVEPIDDDWTTVRVLTLSGERVRYRIPRRTYFEDLDEAAAISQR
jgi:hypothetical protein